MSGQFCGCHKNAGGIEENKCTSTTSTKCTGRLREKTIFLNTRTLTSELKIMPKAALRRKMIAVQKCKLFQHFMVNYRKSHTNSFLLIPPKKLKNRQNITKILSAGYTVYTQLFTKIISTLGVITIPVHCAVK